MHGDVHAGAGELQGDGLADPARSAGDEGNGSEEGKGQGVGIQVETEPGSREAGTP